MAKTGRPKSRDTARSEKLTTYLTPDTFTGLKKLAFLNELTLNDYTAQLVENTVNANAERIRAFEALQEDK